jgi:hypothetical protein
LNIANVRQFPEASLNCFMVDDFYVLTLRQLTQFKEAS